MSLLTNENIKTFVRDGTVLYVTIREGFYKVDPIIKKYELLNKHELRVTVLDHRKYPNLNMFAVKYAPMNIIFTIYTKRDIIRFQPSDHKALP